MPVKIPTPTINKKTHTPGVRYYSSNTVRTKTEAAANETAMDLLLDYCNAYDIPVSNSVAFCEQFGIPTELDYIAYLKIKRILIS